MRETLTRPEPMERRKPRRITRAAVALAVVQCLVLTWLVSGHAQVPLSRAEILATFWASGVLLAAAYLLCQDLMRCQRTREASKVFRLGIAVGRLRGR